MKAIQIESYGSPAEVVQVVDRPGVSAPVRSITVEYRGEENG
jgi:hypothetical protein